MTDAERAAFKAGYLAACCNIAHLHNEQSIAADVLAEAQISALEVSRMKISKYDAQALTEIRLSRSEDPLC